MVRGDQKEEYQLSKGQVLTFKYAEPFARHYLYRGAVDNHNALCHNDGTKHQAGLDNAWITHRWAIRVLGFFIACTEVNLFLCLKYFLKKDEEFRVLRLILVYSLIHNEFLGNRSDRDNLETLSKKKGVHYLETAPDHAKKWRGQIGTVVQNIDTSNISAVAQNARKREDVLHM